jgi:hypothetical protein
LGYVAEKLEELIKVMKSIKKDTHSLDSKGDGKIKREVDGSGFGLDN